MNSILTSPIGVNSTPYGLVYGSERPTFESVNFSLGSKQAKRETTAHRGNVEMPPEE